MSEKHVSQPTHQSIRPIRPDLDDQEDEVPNAMSDENSSRFRSKHVQNETPLVSIPVVNSSTTTQPSNLSAQAMELAHVSSNASSLGTEVSADPSSTPHTRFNSPLMQPILIGLIFFVIFLVSVGTIAYLTYTNASGSVAELDDDQATDQEAEPRRCGPYTAVKIIAVNVAVSESSSANPATSSASSSSDNFDSSHNSSTLSSHNASVFNDRMIIRKV